MENKKNKFVRYSESKFTSGRRSFAMPLTPFPGSLSRRKEIQDSITNPIDRIITKNNKTLERIKNEIETKTRELDELKREIEKKKIELDKLIIEIKNIKQRIL